MNETDEARLLALGAVDESLLIDADVDVLTPDRRPTWIDRLGGLIGREPPAGSILPLIEHGSGSLIAAWRPSEGAAPCFVWIDSEGSPRSVLARSAGELLGLVPHGLGFLYDVLARLARGDSAADLASAVDIAAWTAAGFLPDADPVGTIGRAIAGSPSFADWLASSGPRV